MPASAATRRRHGRALKCSNVPVDGIDLPPSLCPCSPPSSLQFPAALARGASITLASLKLNGKPLLPGPLAAPQAAAADGCLVQLYRLGKAAKGSFTLSGWLGLTEGGGSSTGASNGNNGVVGPDDAFGVGEMASVELTLGEYSLLDAATARLFPGGAAAAAAAQQPGGGAAAPLP